MSRIAKFLRYWNLNTWKHLNRPGAVSAPKPRPSPPIAYGTITLRRGCTYKLETGDFLMIDINNKLFTSSDGIYWKPLKP